MVTNQIDRSWLESGLSSNYCEVRTMGSFCDVHGEASFSQRIFTNGLNMGFPQRGWVENTPTPVKKKFRAQRSVNKVMLTVFCNIKGPMTIDFPEEDAIINSVSHCRFHRQYFILFIVLYYARFCTCQIVTAGTQNKIHLTYRVFNWLMIDWLILTASQPVLGYFMFCGLVILPWEIRHLLMDPSANAWLKLKKQKQFVRQHFQSRPFCLLTCVRAYELGINLYIYIYIYIYIYTRGAWKVHKMASYLLAMTFLITCI